MIYSYIVIINMKTKYNSYALTNAASNVFLQVQFILLRKCFVKIMVFLEAL